MQIHIDFSEVSFLQCIVIRSGRSGIRNPAPPITYCGQRLANRDKLPIVEQTQKLGRLFLSTDD